MPTYDYRCEACGQEVELVQKISEKEAPVCLNTSCSSYGTEMETVIGATSFILKGSGWAKDGYK